MRIQMCIRDRTEAPKAEEPKKETKKAPAKRAAAKDIKTSVVVQFAGKEVTEKELIAAVKKAYTKKGNKVCLLYTSRCV